MADIGDMIARLLLDSSQFSKGMTEAGTQSEQAGAKVEGAFGKVGGILEGVGGAAAGLGAALGITSFGNACVEAAAKMASMHSALVALNGAGAETEKMFEDLKEMEDKSKFDFDQIAQGAKTLLMMGASADTATKAMQAIVDTVSALKLGPEHINSIASALGRMEATGVASSKSMLALVKEGIPAWSLLADKIGTDVRGAMDLMAKGAVDADTVISAVVEGLNAKYAGSAEKATKTWKGQWDQISKATEDAQAAIGTSITAFLNKIAGVLTPMLETLKKFEELWKGLPGPVQEAIVIFGVALAGIAALAGTIAAWGLALGGITAAWGAVAAAMAPVLAAVGLAGAPFLAVAVAVAAAIAALVLLYEWINSHWSEISAAISNAWAGISEIWSGIWTGIVKTVTDIWSGITGLATTIWQGILAYLGAVWGPIIDLYVAAWTAIIGALTTAWNTVKTTATELWDALVAYLSTIWDGVKQAFSDGWDAIVTALTAVWGGIKSAAESAFGPVIATLTGMWEVVKIAFATAWDAITKALTEAFGGVIAKVQGFVEGVANWFGKVGGYFSGVTEGAKKLSETNAVYDAQTQKLKEQEEQLKKTQKALEDKTAADKAAAEEAEKHTKAVSAYNTMAKTAGVQTLGQLREEIDKVKAAREGMSESIRNGIGVEGDLVLMDIKLRELQKELAGGGKGLIEDRKRQADAAKKLAEETKKAADEEEKAYQKHVKIIADSNTAASQLALTIGKVNAAMHETVPQVEITVNAMDNWNPKIKEAILNNLALKAAAHDLGQTVQGDLQAAADQADRAYAKMTASGQASSADLVEAQKKVKAAHEAVNDYVNKDLTDAYKGLGITSTQVLQDNITKAQEWRDKVIDAYTKGKASAEDVRLANEAVLASQKANADHANKDMIDAYHNLGMKTSQEWETMVTKAEESYAKISTDGTASAAQVETAWVEKTKTAYAAIVAQGGTLTEDQKTELAKRETAIQDHLDTTVSKWKTAYESIKTSVQGFFDELITGIVTGDLSFGQAVTKMWQSIAETALHTFTDPVRDAVAKFIANELADLLGGKGLGGVLDNLKQIGTAVSGVFGGAAKTGTTVAGGVATAGGGAASAGGGAASAATGAVGMGLSGVVGVVSGAITAISSVISNFQFAHMETSLNAIEHNTRYTMMYVGERADGGILGILFKIDEEIAWGFNTKATENLRDLFKDYSLHVSPIFESIRDQLVGISPYIADTKTVLEDIRTLTMDSIGVFKRGLDTLNVSVTATGVTTVEAARRLGDQIAANLSRQLVQTS